MSLFYTGRLYAREVISQKQRELCAVAALTVLHRLEELRLHIGAALNVGATKEEVAEVIFQMMTYGGVPTTVEGLKICKAVLEERGLWQETWPVGRRLRRCCRHQAASWWEGAPGITMCRASRLVEQRSISTPSRHGRAKDVNSDERHCGLTSSNVGQWEDRKSVV